MKILTKTGEIVRAEVEAFGLAAILHQTSVLVLEIAVIIPAFQI